MNPFALYDDTPHENENKILMIDRITVYAFSRAGAAKKWPLRGS